MLFNSFQFIFLFLPFVLMVSKLLRGSALLVWISIVSCVFYAFAGHVWFLGPMAITTLLDFWIGNRIHQEVTPRRRKVYLLVSLIANLGLLAYFKYSGLLFSTFITAKNWFGFEDIHPAQFWFLKDVILPAGISFYTFQTMSYVLDIYRGVAKPEKSFFRYLSFVSFFPHLVAGPLTRHDQLIPQLATIEKNGFKIHWQSGIFLFFIGLIKKVLIADRIANLIDPIIDHISVAGTTHCWLAMIGYSLQIYFDFSGYSDMAIGLGRLFSIELPRNFNSPYQSLDPSDFWRRWHITLSQWLRDYLYISMGGNRCSQKRIRFNLMMTMVLGGLWHGANWTFACWGAFHGLGLLIYHEYQEEWSRVSVGLRKAITFLFVCLGWVWFRATTIPQALSWYQGLFTFRGLLPGESINIKLAVLCLFGLIISMCFSNAAKKDLSRVPLYQAAVLGVVAFAALLMMNESSRFLYFQF